MTREAFVEETPNSYDAANRLTALTNPQSEQTTFAYDDVGNRTGLTRANGVTEKN